MTPLVRATPAPISRGAPLSKVASRPMEETTPPDDEAAISEHVPLFSLTERPAWPQSLGMRRTASVHRLLLASSAFLLFGSGGCSRRGAMEADAGNADARVDANDARDRCEATQTTCGSSLCCPMGSACIRGNSCCALENVCGSTCCGGDQVCEGAVCHLECAPDIARCHDDAGAEVCCGADEVCANDRCYLPTTECSDFFECAEGESCETALGVCLPLPGGPPCLTDATAGDVRPSELWRWDGAGRRDPSSNQVVMAPMVANLTDDTEDGLVDVRDIPDVVFATFTGSNYASDGILRAVSGLDGSVVFDQLDVPVDPLATPAIGDLDGDGFVEIVTCGSRDQTHDGLVAFDHTGRFLWANDLIECRASGISIANLDAEGDPEIIVRFQVVDSRGAVRWRRTCLNSPDIGRGEHYPCSFTTAADMDNDGLLEVVGGNLAYRQDGSVYFNHSADWRDGFPAIADLDLDGDPEIVVVQSAFTRSGTYQGDHFIRALNGDGTPLWGPFDINGTMAAPADVTAGTVGGGGPPTVANLDDDPQPEIALAGGYSYVVFNHDGTLLWERSTRDRSSRKTGSSVFDFDGDGRAEAVYNDEHWLRVYDGATGDVRYCECNTTATLYEYPVIADVNNDGHAEIVVSSNDYAADTCPTTIDLDSCTQARIDAGETRGSHGIRVLAAPMRDWAATRRIWNQHAYHVTNVTERGGIPLVERRHWTVPGLNDFRLNTQPGALNAPNLVPLDLGVELRNCPTGMTFHVRIRNQGWAAAYSRAVVEAFATGPSGERSLGRQRTTRTLLPGESEILEFAVPLRAGEAEANMRFRVHVIGGDAIDRWSQSECRTDDNDAMIEAACDAIL